MFKSAEFLETMKEAGYLSQEDCDRISDTARALEAVIDRSPEADITTKHASILGDAWGIAKAFGRGAKNMLHEAPQISQESVQGAEKFMDKMRAFEQVSGHSLMNDSERVGGYAKNYLDSMKGGEGFVSGLQKAAPVMAIGASIPVIEHFISQNQAGNSFEKMLDIYPDLRSEDPEAVMNAYDIVSSYAPQMANSPVAAGAAVSKFIQFNAVDPAHLQQLLQIEEKKRDLSPMSSISRTLSEGFLGQGVKNMGGGGMK